MSDEVEFTCKMYLTYKFCENGSRSHWMVRYIGQIKLQIIIIIGVRKQHLLSRFIMNYKNL